MNRLTRFTLALLAFALIVAACDAGDAESQAGPTAPPTINDAESTARAFLDGWVANDYGAMYAQLSAKAQLIPLTSKDANVETFSKIYQDVNRILQIGEDEKDKKSYTIHADQTERLGNSAAIHYDMTFKSKLVGDFTDSGRTLHLILANGKWRVAWSTMDVFEGMAGGAKLTVNFTQSKRGTIYDRKGNVIAEDGVTNYAIRLLPGKYPGNSADCFKLLANLFRVRADDLNKLYGPDIYTPAMYGNFGFTIGTLSEPDYQRLKPQLDAACGYVKKDQNNRYYYGGSFAAQTVGYMGQVTNDDLARNPGLSPGGLVGRQGIEQYYQDKLAGSSGADLEITTPDGILVRTIYSKAAGASQKPQDITLTLDRDLQLATEKALASAASDANWGQFSTGAAAVVLDVHTGEVLAIASYPTVDPDVFLPNNTFDVQDVLADYNKRRSTFNRATQELYAAGSVFKVVSTAAAADSGTVKLTDVYVCTGVWDGSKKGDRVRYDWIYNDPYAEKPYHDAITLQQGLTSSCDAYFWEVGSKLEDVSDATLLHDYGKKMGLGVKTGIDSFLGEEEGVIPYPKWKALRDGKPTWGLGDNLNTVIGQGDVKVTPIQVARMMMGVANGGTLYHPYIIKSVGATVNTPAAPDQIGIQPTVLKGIQAGLCGVVSDPKLGTANFVFDYDWDPTIVTVCGKTGTAQTGSPYPNGWFAAYASRTGKDPDIAVVVLTEHSREGSETAGPIVRRIIESYYKLPLTHWPNFWYAPYDPMKDPDASDGGGPRTTKNTTK
jgi:penicillin-binding protein 2